MDGPRSTNQNHSFGLTVLDFNDKEIWRSSIIAATFLAFQTDLKIRDKDSPLTSLKETTLPTSQCSEPGSSSIRACSVTRKPYSSSVKFRPGWEKTVHWPECEKGNHTRKAQVSCGTSQSFGGVVFI
ncbi:hypothetical protein V6N11_013620 [Hibiscus sabdariffa]|uniref:Uncharacterized protein n=1 Tax=Hibiscus sabdariffa TaxID=183260 RepID=A0ABR1ZY27_9ROSI